MLLAERINEEKYNGNPLLNDSLGQFIMILKVKNQWYSLILLDSLGLFLCPNKSVEGAIWREAGALPAGKESASEIAGSTSDEDIVRHPD